VATASSTVELIVEAARAINPLRKVERQTKRVENQFEKARRSTKRVEAALVLMGRTGMNSIRDLEANTARLGKAMGGLRGNLAKATIGFAAFKSVQEGIRRIDSERRLRLLTRRFGETAEAQEIARKAAEKFNLSQTEANVQLSRLIARLRPMGLSMQTIGTAFAGFNTATILAGATASESAGAFLQLSQALGSGVLRGQELNSILEQAPLIAQAIATEMDTTVGALKKFGEEGQITSEIVIAALGRVEREGAGQLAEALEGPSAKIKAFQNAVQDAQVAISESSVPAIADSMQELGTVIRQLEPAIKFIGELLAGVAKTVGNIVENISTGGALAAAQKAANEAATLQTREKFGFNIFSQEAQAFRAEVLERELARRVAIVRGAVPGQLPPSAATLPADKPDAGGRFKPDSSKKTAAQLRKEEAIALREFLELNKLMTLEMDRQDELDEMAGKHLAFQLNEADKISLNQDQRLGKLKAQIAGTEEEFALNQAIEEIKRKGLLPADEERLINAERHIHAMNKQAQLAAEQKRLFEQIGQTIETAIVDSLLEAKSATEALSGVLKQAARQFLSAGFGSFGFGGNKGSGLFGAIGDIFRANGGPVTGGRSYIVGERGPEVFTPGVSGGITPNSALGGASVTVNVDASGSSVEGNADQASQLGKAIGIAVQQELVKQKRPGGLLAS